MQLPTARDEQRSWIGVAVVAVIGFAVGIAWPRLLDVRVGPAAPTPVSKEPTAPIVPSAATASAAASAGMAAPSASGGSVVAVPVSIAKPYTLSCRTPDGETHRKASECGALGDVNAAFEPRLRKVAMCPAARGASGKLSLVLGAEFGTNKVSVELGKATAIAKADDLLACAKEAMTGVSLTGIEHDNPRYSILYHLTFSGEGAASVEGDAGTVAKASDVARITFGKAIIRDGPKASSNRLDSLTRGTEVKVVDQQGGWYKVRFGDGFSSEGWVYRQAIGK